MVDYNTLREIDSDDRIAYLGVMDIFRYPKLAAFAYSSQQDQNPILEVTGNLYIGNDRGLFSNKVYAFTNCDYIKLYRNKEYISTFYPDKKDFPNLKHPPIIIDDFIGDELVKYEKFSEKDSRKAKKMIRNINNTGTNLPFGYRIKIWFLSQKYHISYDECLKILRKYQYGNASKDASYRYDGYVGNVLVKSVVTETTKEINYVIETSRKRLEITDTYDVQRFVVKAVNQVGRTLPYCFDPIKIEVTGSVSLIGPDKVNLQGGVVGFWVKTNGQKGPGTIKIIGENTIIETVIVK
jgi:beta-galactosidase